MPWLWCFTAIYLSRICTGNVVYEMLCQLFILCPLRYWLFSCLSFCHSFINCSLPYYRYFWREEALDFTNKTKCSLSDPTIQVIKGYIQWMSLIFLKSYFQTHQALYALHILLGGAESHHVPRRFSHKTAVLWICEPS